MNDPTDLKGQRRQADEKCKRDQLAAENAAADFKWLAGSERGRRLLWQWMGDCKVFGSTFVPDAATAAFQEGQRNVGLWFLGGVMQHCPEQFVVMQAEAVERSRKASA